MVRMCSYLAWLALFALLPGCINISESRTSCRDTTSEAIISVDSVDAAALTNDMPSCEEVCGAYRPMLPLVGCSGTSQIHCSFREQVCE